jgi:hypothetical protein
MGFSTTVPILVMAIYGNRTDRDKKKFKNIF